MKKAIITAVLLIALIPAAVRAQSGFTALGGFNGGVSFSLSSSLSGYTTAPNGMILDHGALLPLVFDPTGVETVDQEAENSGISRIYTIDGMEIAAPEGTDFDLNTLSPGLYVIRRGNSVEKFLKTR